MKPRRERPKKTVSASGGLEPLEMVLEPDTGQCTSKNSVPKVVDCEILHWSEKGTKHFL